MTPANINNRIIKDEEIGKERKTLQRIVGQKNDRKWRVWDTWRTARYLAVLRVGTPTEQQVREVIKNVKNNNSVGSNDLPVEIIKYVEEILIIQIISLVKSIICEHKEMQKI